MAALTYMPIFAHFGHWYVSIPTFMAPVVAIAIAVKMSERRALRRAREGDADGWSAVRSEHQDGTTLRVSGPVNYLGLLDIEHELGLAVERDLPITLDLRVATPAEDDFAWSILGVIGGFEGADVTIQLGSTATMQELSRLCAVEGVKVDSASSEKPLADGVDVPPSSDRAEHM